MKKQYGFIILFVLTCFTAVAAVSWDIDDEVSGITFTIKNLGKKVQGSFGSPEGIIEFDQDHPEKAKFDVKVPVKSISTRNEKRDAHLLSDDFFDEAKYPYIYFKSKNTLSTGENNFTTTGDLTIKNVTKEVTIPFEFMERGDNGYFVGNLFIKRRDYGVGGRSLMLKNEVKVKILVTTKR